MYAGGHFGKGYCKYCGTDPDTVCTYCNPLYVRNMQRVEEENRKNDLIRARIQRARPKRVQYMYADRPAANRLAWLEAMGPVPQPGEIGKPVEWRFRERTAAEKRRHEELMIGERFRPRMKGESYEDYRIYQMTSRVPESMPHLMRAEYAQKVPYLAQKELHERRMQNVEKDFGSRLSTPPKKPRKKLLRMPDPVPEERFGGRRK